MADISFVVEKDGTLSNVAIIQTDGGTELRDELKRLFDEIPQCQPLLLSVDGPERTYEKIQYKLSFALRSAKSGNK